MSDQPIDPNTRFTGGAKIIFKKPEERYCSGMEDDYWGKDRIGHIAHANQPLSAYVQAALCEKGCEGQDFEIVAFAPEIGLIIVNADLTQK